MGSMRASNMGSAWVVPAERVFDRRGTKTPGGAPAVLLIDDRPQFRRAVSERLEQEGVQVMQAAGVYDALRLVHRCTVDWIAIRGDLKSESGWQCAAKLCGYPPWSGVLLYFDRPGQSDRARAAFAGTPRLVKTSEQPDDVTVAILGLAFREPRPLPGGAGMGAQVCAPLCLVT